MHACTPGSPPDPSPHSLLVSVDLRAGRVRVSGDLDRSSAHHLLDGFAALESTDHQSWTLDAGGLTSCDAHGLRKLTRAVAMATGLGRAVRVVDPPPFLERLIGLAGLDRFLVPGAPPGVRPVAVAPRSAGPRGAARAGARGQALRCSTKS